MTQRGESMRLFVAIELPDEWREALDKTQEQMQQALAVDSQTSSLRLRWVLPEGIHLTLKFIGAVDGERLPVIQQQLELAVPEMPDIALQVGPAGSFTDRRSPRVIWASLQSEQAQSLLQLAERIETWLAAAGVPREKRVFRSHLTLARLPNDVPDELRHRVVEVTAGVQMPALAPFTVERVSLMRSHLGPGGTRYERLAVYPV